MNILQIAPSHNCSAHTYNDQVWPEDQDHSLTKLWKKSPLGNLTLRGTPIGMVEGSLPETGVGRWRDQIEQTYRFSAQIVCGELELHQRGEQPNSPALLLDSLCGLSHIRFFYRLGVREVVAFRASHVAALERVPPLKWKRCLQDTKPYKF